MSAELFARHSGVGRGVSSSFERHSGAPQSRGGVWSVVRLPATGRRAGAEMPGAVTPRTCQPAVWCPCRGRGEHERGGHRATARQRQAARGRRVARRQNVVDLGASADTCERYRAVRFWYVPRWGDGADTCERYRAVRTCAPSTWKKDELAPPTADPVTPSRVVPIARRPRVTGAIGPAGHYKVQVAMESRTPECLVVERGDGRL